MTASPPTTLVFGPAYLDRVIRVDRPLVDPELGDRPLDESIDGRLLELFDEWDREIGDAANEEQRKSVLDRMSELLSHRSYIHNLVRDINEEL